MLNYAQFFISLEKSLNSDKLNAHKYVQIYVHIYDQEMLDQLELYLVPKGFKFVEYTSIIHADIIMKKKVVKYLIITYLIHFFSDTAHFRLMISIFE